MYAGGYSQVFQVSPRELSVCDDLDLSLALLANLYRVAQITHAVVDLDLFMEEFLESGNVEDLV